ncbi:cobaltochelatase subunit CobN [Xylophilus sp. Leaf220]|uniref:cobaltochelatase subunit CobN n=1 Tax=Xylophilus sp. Leaf220 TaxID=1735686 RepID=UPI001EFFD61C|nr:cobaltochelatase subunit CobN [Xylophilus sp. Leaf220]
MLALLLLCVLTPSARAATLLWLTADVTPATRTALLQRLGSEAGLPVQHIEYPITGVPGLDGAQATALDQALSTADLVWIDAPHPTIEARLRSVVGPRSEAFAQRKPNRLAWGTTAFAAGDTPAARMAAYLKAGGEANMRHAVALAAAVATGAALPTLPAPQPFATRGLYTPGAPELFADAEAFARWQATQSALKDLPTIALLVHRYHFVNGATDWIDQWIALFRRHGLLAYAAFGPQADAAGLSQLLEVPDGAGGRTLQARALVLHQLVPQAAALQPLFDRWGAPVIATQPYRQGGTAEWEADAQGLAFGDVPFYLAQPEGAGAVDPLMVLAHADGGRRPELVVRQADAVAAKVRRLVALRDTPRAQKRLVAMVYNYPPGGTNFGASFLNVPRSLERVSQGLADAGYTTRGLPEAQWIDGLKPLLRAYYPDADLRGLLETGQAAALPLADYERWFGTLPAAVRQRIEGQWGPAARSRYVVQWQGAPVFVVPRLQVGNLSVLPQPPREETLRQGQNAFMHRSKTPLSHHYLVVYLWAAQADALIHFGTHGTQEWAPGKARALDVHDDALLPLGDVPVVYPYIVDNLGEALTAKRRGRAVLVSHKTPVFSPAGFNARMAHMHELMHEWETVDAGPTRAALEKELTAQFVEHNLHRDLGWSAERIAQAFEPFLEILHPYLDSLAQSSQPKGMAAFGIVPDAAQRQQTILQALRKPLIEALGEDIDEAFLIDHTGIATARPARWLAVALRDPQAASMLDLRPAASAAGPVGAVPVQATTDTVASGPPALQTSVAPAAAARPPDALVRAEDFVPNRAARKPIDSPALLALARRAQQLDALLATEGEMPGLLGALDGRFIQAAYGGDPIRNPDSLPTGRNLTGLDPARLPTRNAYEVAQTVFADWLQGWRASHGGAMPGRLALSLWAGETLRQQGVMEAQALVALGVRPVWDDSGRPVKVELIPRQELQRPRVDVLLSITGSYRDQFPALMALIDQAVAAAAQAEPDNAVATNTRQVAAELRQRGVPQAQAAALARARSFGNTLGDYGTGIAEAVQDDGLKAQDARLGELFLQRMSQPYLDGQPLPDIAPGTAREALGAHLRRTDAAVMSRSSHLYAMVSSDDPFQYLGGLAAAARSAGRKEEVGLYVNQLQDSGEPVTETAQRAIALEMQSRYLHPGWLQAQKAEGYAGTLQVLKAVQFAWGWQSVQKDSIRSDHWQSFYEVLVQDKHRLGVPQWLDQNRQAYAQTLERLVQAQRQGYWQADAATQRDLAERYRALTRAEPLALEQASVRQWADQRAAPAVPATPVGMQAAANAAAAPVAPPPAAQPAAPAALAAVPPPEQGVRLERVPDPPPASAAASRLIQWLAGALVLLVIAAGAAWQAQRPGAPRWRTAAGT